MVLEELAWFPHLFGEIVQEQSGTGAIGNPMIARYR